MAARFLWLLLGFALAAVLWSLGVGVLEQRTPIAAMFAPVETMRALTSWSPGPISGCT